MTLRQDIMFRTIEHTKLMTQISKQPMSLAVCARAPAISALVVVVAFLCVLARDRGSHDWRKE